MDAVILGVRGLLAPRRLPTPTILSDESMRLLRSALRDLSSRTPVVFLDDGPADELEAWARNTGAADLAAFRLWTRRLGGQAKAPSRLPFRFVARRLDITCSASLYAGCDEGLLEAAVRSGCPAWDVREQPPEAVPGEVAGMLEWLRQNLAAS